MLRGAWKPDGMPVEIIHTFCNANDPAYGASEVARITVAGRTPMVTVEPWEWFTGKTRELLFDWRRVLRGSPEGTLLRVGHEMNGSWYPWAGNPQRFHSMWADWFTICPDHVRLVFSPNVSYPGSRPIADYWPGAEVVDAIGLDGYARDGESMRDVFEPSLREVCNAAERNLPLMICETGTPRGRSQARWWREGMTWAERQGIAAVIAFSENKEGKGPDERDWTLTKGARKAFLGG